MRIMITYFSFETTTKNVLKRLKFERSNFIRFIEVQIKKKGASIVTDFMSGTRRCDPRPVKVVLCH